MSTDTAQAIKVHPNVAEAAAELLKSRFGRAKNSVFLEMGAALIELKGVATKEALFAQTTAELSRNRHVLANNSAALLPHRQRHLENSWQYMLWAIAMSMPLYAIERVVQLEQQPMADFLTCPDGVKAYRDSTAYVIIARLDTGEGLNISNAEGYARYLKEIKRDSVCDVYAFKVQDVVEHLL